MCLCKHVCARVTETKKETKEKKTIEFLWVSKSMFDVESKDWFLYHETNIRRSKYSDRKKLRNQYCEKEKRARTEYTFLFR